MKEEIKQSYEKIKPNQTVREQMLKAVLDSGHSDLKSNGKSPMGKEFFMRKAIVAAVMAISILTVSGGVYAGYRWMNAKEVVSEIGDQKLAKYFDVDEDAIQVQENEEYRAAFLGTVSGSRLSASEDWDDDGEDIDKARTYIVTVIERKDGKPITNDNNIVVSPFISGVRPMDFSIYSIHGGASMHPKDGALYVLTECDDLEIFADRDVYLGVIEGADFGGIAYDEQSGAISRKTDYDGLNFLFQLELDTSKADAKKAQAYLDQMLNGEEKSAEEKANEQQEADAIGRWVNPENPEKFLQECTYVKGSKKVLTPDEEDELTFSYGDGGLVRHSAKDIREKKLVVNRVDTDDITESVIAWSYENGQYIAKFYEHINEEFQGHDDLNEPEKVIAQSKMVEGSEKILKPDENGRLIYQNDTIELATRAKAVKKNGMDALLLYGEDGEDDQILTFTYEDGKYIGRLYTCSKDITRKAEKKK